MGRLLGSLRGRIFALAAVLSILPALAVALLARGHLEQSVDLWSNRGVAETLSASRRVADSLASWEGERLAADSALCRDVETLERGIGFWNQVALLAPIEKRALTLEVSLLAAGAIGLALLVAKAAGDRMARPIERLIEGTERVRAGDLSHHVPRESAGELGRLVAAWNRMTDDLARSRERLRRVEKTAAWGEAARRVAHEIKNPLTPIELSLHRIQKRLPEMPPGVREPVEESLRALVEEVGHLGRLAEEFSAFSRLPSPRPAPCDLEALLREIAALHAGSGVAFRVEVEPAAAVVRADAGLLRIAVGNLVKNAIEAMEGRGAIVLSARAGEGRLAIDVADSGPGVPPERRERLFDPLFTTKPGGSGIGLALVERIAVDAGGSATLVDQPGGGARFRIEIPLAGGSPPESPA